MEIITKSGIVNVNKATPYGKWLSAYVASGAWSGSATVENCWIDAKSAKPVGVSWSAWGKICGNLTANGVPVLFACASK